jgi:alkylated DNA repair dioxygenase AlkB
MNRRTNNQVKPGSGLQRIELPGADLRFAPAWLSGPHADALFSSMRNTIDWETHRIRMFGREIDSPRSSSWIGDPGTIYTYSRTRFEPRPWPQPLLPIRDQLEALLATGFNSVLANRYRDGRDYMGWHSDDEPELGAQPIIASLSLGATRRFVLKPRGAGQRLDLDLPHGSLLIMSGQTQALYRHALPSTKRPVGERINLTFRRILRKA